MTKPTRMESYPVVFQELANRFTQGERRIELRFPSHKLAASFRFTFYCFRKAVRLEKAESMFPQLNSITATLDNLPHGDCMLVLMHADDTPAAQALQAVLDQLPEMRPLPSPAPTPATDEPSVDTVEEAFARFMNKEPK